MKTLVLSRRMLTKEYGTSSRKAMPSLGKKVGVEGLVLSFHQVLLGIRDSLKRGGGARWLSLKPF